MYFLHACIERYNQIYLANKKKKKEESRTLNSKADKIFHLVSRFYIFLYKTTPSTGCINILIHIKIFFFFFYQGWILCPLFNPLIPLGHPHFIYVLYIRHQFSYHLNYPQKNLTTNISTSHLSKIKKRDDDDVVEFVLFPCTHLFFLTILFFIFCLETILVSSGAESNLGFHRALLS